MSSTSNGFSLRTATAIVAYWVTVNKAPPPPPKGSGFPPIINERILFMKSLALKLLILFRCAKRSILIKKKKLGKKSEVSMVKIPQHKFTKSIILMRGFSNLKLLYSNFALVG